MLFFDDTIAAIATPAGRGGLGVIRVSGSKAVKIVAQVAPQFNPKAVQRAQLLHLQDPDTKQFIDEAVLLYFRAPRSYTGQDVVEISCHGSPFILSQLLPCCFHLGALAATPGGFTMRAFVSGRIDLTQAEAVRDLIDAQTAYQVKCATRQLQGALSRYLQPIKDELLAIIVQLESAVEFVEENLDIATIEILASRLESLRQKLSQLSESYRAGRIVREGIKIAIIGRPNVGKSSLFNALLQQDRAIVTDVPGTTRDILTEQASIGGIPVTLVDTAGIRTAQDLVEQLGIERSYAALADADLVMLVLDASCILQDEDQELLTICQNSTVPSIIIINKSDLLMVIEQAIVQSCLPKSTVFMVSAKSGLGVDALQKGLISKFLGQAVDSREDILVLDARHFTLLKIITTELQNAVQVLEEGFSEEVALCHLHLGLNKLGEITGETTVEDILGQIFETFCIGK